MIFEDVGASVGARREGHVQLMMATRDWRSRISGEVSTRVHKLEEEKLEEFERLEF